MANYRENIKDGSKRATDRQQMFIGELIIVAIISYIVASIFFDSAFSYKYKEEWAYITGVVIVSIGGLIFWRKYYKKLDKTFFYQEPIREDGYRPVPKEKFKYLASKDKAISMDNFFDFNEIGEDDPNGTSRIKKLFRYTKNGLLEDKKSKEYQLHIKELKSGNDFSSLQEQNYYDVYGKIEKLLQGYNKEEFISKDIEPPIALKNGEIVINPKEVSDVYLGGKEVYFSIYMIRETTKVFLKLFDDYIEKNIKIKSPFVKEYINFFIDEDKKQKMLDIFKIVFSRYLMQKYGAMVAGWYIIKLYDYDTRAIISYIDDKQTIAITTYNNGSNEIYPDDRFASAFLTIYFNFLNSYLAKEYLKIIDFRFDPVKNIGSIHRANRSELDSLANGNFSREDW